MKKKPTPIYKNWWFPLVSAGVILPTVGFIWTQANNVWSAPQEIKTVKEAVIQQAQIASDLKQMVDRNEKKDAEQDAEIEKSKEISALQIDSLKEILKSFQRPR